MTEVSLTVIRVTGTLLLPQPLQVPAHVSVELQIVPPSLANTRIELERTGKISPDAEEHVARLTHTLHSITSASL